MINQTTFYEYLVQVKKFNERSARDVISRCNRVRKMIQVDEIQEDALDKLLAQDTFMNCSTFVRSQLKRSILLYREYLDGIQTVTPN